jgi:hypothetical protein
MHNCCAAAITLWSKLLGQLVMTLEAAAETAEAESMSQMHAVLERVASLLC